MLEKQTSHSENMRNINPIEAYKILLQQQINNDRLLSERTTIYLAASSILFLAFVMLNQSSVILAPALIRSLRIILPILGIFLTILFCSFNRATLNTLKFLWRGQENIERRAPEFAYMRKNGIAPQIDGWDFTYERKEWVPDKNKSWVSKPIVERNWWGRSLCYLFKNLSQRWLPLTFGVLWVASLIVGCLS